MNEDLDMISFGIIASAGDSRSFAFQALQAARKGDFDQSKELMERSHEAYAKAHKAQTDLLFAEVNGDHKAVNVLLVHSQDHLMNAMTCIDLIEEMILTLRTQNDLEARIDILEKEARR